MWAPAVGRVELIIENRRIDLKPRGGGWWHCDEPAKHLTYYSYSLEEGPSRPDPRSAWQPVGPDGASRIVDHGLFKWSDGSWHGATLSDAIFYELHIGTFTPEGTFDAAIGRLDHLVDLGVTAVELMPVAEFSGDHGWGYDGVDLFAPHHAYGGPDGLKRFVNACHERGLAVVMDVVYNHLGPSGNYLREFGPYFTDRYSTPWGDAVNFDDADSDEVRRFVVDNALAWLRDYHCDGLRVDAVHAIYDASATHILEELSIAVEELQSDLGRPLWVIAESDLNDPRIVTPRDRGGYGVDAQWSDDFHHALHALVTGERMGYYSDFGAIEDLAVALEQAFVYAGRHSDYRKRRHGRKPEDLPATRFLGYLQNHDQIGNRAQGERSAALLSHDMLHVVAAIVLTSPFVPMLFQGEEWGASTPFQYFTDHLDPALGRAVSEGRRREFATFGWDPEDVPDPQDPATFERSKLKWNELDEGDHAELLEWHKKLIALRREYPSLSDGSFATDLRFDETERWLAFDRGPLTVVCNFSKEQRDVGDVDGDVILASKAPDSGAVPPESVRIVARRDGT
ncbi:MAG TPA: malto-oligosyltrehalose trehalohydrolase [Actinomycetota bacterium]|nr:malto-oligosyltrehalose trehalohydrolase [Actinomycetota bacterium]